MRKLLHRASRRFYRERWLLAVLWEASLLGELSWLSCARCDRTKAISPRVAIAAERNGNGR